MVQMDLFGGVVYQGLESPTMADKAKEVEIKGDLAAPGAKKKRKTTTSSQPKAKPRQQKRPATRDSLLERVMRRKCASEEEELEELFGKPVPGGTMLETKLEKALVADTGGTQCEQQQQKQVFNIKLEPPVTHCQDLDESSDESAHDPDRPPLGPWNTSCQPRWQYLKSSDSSTSAPSSSVADIEVQEAVKTLDHLFKEKCSAHMQQDSLRPELAHTHDDPDLAELTAMMKGEKKLDLQRGFGKMFARQHAKGSPGHVEYNRDKSQRAKDEFKKKWLSMEIQKRTEAKSVIKEWQDINTELGEYMCAASIIERQGFWADRSGAIARGMHYVKACISMGGKWCTHWDMTQGAEYFYVRRQNAQIFGEKYKLFQEWSNNNEKPEKQETTTDGDSKAGKAEEGNRAEGLLPKGKGKGKGKNKPADVPTPDKDGDPVLTKEISLANKTKKDYHSAVGTADITLSNAQHQPSWSRLNTVEALGPLKRAMTRLEGVLNQDFRFILLNDTAELKHKFGPTVLKQKLKLFNSTVSEHSEDVADEVQRLSGMCKAAQKTRKAKDIK